MQIRRKISRKEALEISRKILEDAEEERNKIDQIQVDRSIKSLKKLLDEVRNMTVEEYNQLYNSTPAPEEDE